ATAPSSHQAIPSRPRVQRPVGLRTAGRDGSDGPQLPDTILRGYPISQRLGFERTIRTPGATVQPACGRRRGEPPNLQRRTRPMLVSPDRPTAPTRRRLLQLGGLGALGLSLPGLLRAGDRTPNAPIRSCVLFLLHGGPSQLDTWDMKPDAPAEVRG